MYFLFYFQEEKESIQRHDDIIKLTAGRLQLSRA
jgi:hypothetical protein